MAEYIAQGAGRLNKRPKKLNMKRDINGEKNI